MERLNELPSQEKIQHAIKRCESVYREMNVGVLFGLGATLLPYLTQAVLYDPSIHERPVLSLLPALVGFVGAEALYRVGQINHKFANELQRDHTSALETA